MVKQNKLKRSIRVILWIVVILVIIGARVGYWGYNRLYAPDFKNEKTVYVYVDRDLNYDDLCCQLTDSAHCARIDDFKALAKVLKYPDNLKIGRYAVEPGMSHLALLNKLRRGQQTVTRITFNNIRLVDNLAERLDEQLMIDKDEILHYLNDPEYCRSLGFNTETIGALFIPNTYEMYWNVSAESLIQRMKREYEAFWTDERKQKAKAIDLTPVEVSTLASIVEEESAATEEYSVIAGLYLNRIWKGMPLEADPTLKFAVGNFAIKRVLNWHKEVDSPYNTYMYAGLPPGPIRTPSIKGLDAVLNYMPHKYLFMCAKEDFSGRHNFAVTLAEHNRNAARYHAELNRRRIR
ncbi:aminodeoxychorismate lyase [Bacteroidia bacterium]|nr:aminodeoxychorismate lyase [Bacteroidia bacterium]